ncbi:MAG: hypothetical protein C0524_00330 [Rhodobacter sp.]|nr:hypothetical protein [Rhodobacter sp.]
MVIVAGETGPAANWSLGGYARPTSPELATRDIRYIKNATSCGAAMATSLPCIFSPLTRDSYSYEGRIGTENLLDVLSPAGLKVESWDNNSGDNRVILAMHCMSDVGECLGEGGLYLHGTPWFMASEKQTHVPMVIWMSDRFRATLGLKEACLTNQLEAPVTHDNMFLTVIRLLDVTTEARVPALGLAAECRAKAS